MKHSIQYDISKEEIPLDPILVLCAEGIMELYALTFFKEPVNIYSEMFHYYYLQRTPLCFSC